MHASLHSYYDIEDKGVTLNYSTKVFEVRHGPLKDAYQLDTNFKDFVKQVCNLVTF
jgi:hypothetical protein